MGDRAHEMAMRQTQWTRTEAIAWAEGRFARSGHWPTRRFRVQGSRAGTSKLLSKTEAHATMTRYGGEIVEVVPSRPAYMEEFKGIRLDAYPVLTVSAKLALCPTCAAPEGTPCKLGDGSPIWPHKRRIRAAGFDGPVGMMLAQAVVYDHCTACGAGPGGACTKPYPKKYQHARAVGDRMIWWPHRLRKFADKAQAAEVRA